MKYILEANSEEELKVGDCCSCSFCHWEHNLDYGEWDGTFTVYCPFKENPIAERYGGYDEELENIICPVCIKKTE